MSEAPSAACRPVQEALVVAVRDEHVGQPHVAEHSTSSWTPTGVSSDSESPTWRQHSAPSESARLTLR